VRGEWELSYKKRFPDYPLGECNWFYQVKARLFEGAGAGAMVLTDNFPELGEMFAVGKEVVTYTCGCSDEVKEKLDWYLKNDSERERIARAGNKRAKADHTLTCRVRQIMQLARKMI
jgi:spore maturation protein CgeB